MSRASILKLNSMLELPLDCLVMVLSDVYSRNVAYKSSDRAFETDHDWNDFKRNDIRSTKFELEK